MSYEDYFSIHCFIYRVMKRITAQTARNTARTRKVVTSSRFSLWSWSRNPSARIDPRPPMEEPEPRLRAEPLIGIFASNTLAGAVSILNSEASIQVLHCGQGPLTPFCESSTIRLVPHAEHINLSEATG